MNTKPGLSEGEAIRREDIARNLIGRHIGRLVDAWINIDALQRRYPNATSGADRDTLNELAKQIGETNA